MCTYTNICIYILEYEYLQEQLNLTETKYQSTYIATFRYIYRNDIGSFEINMKFDNRNTPDKREFKNCYSKTSK